MPIPGDTRFIEVQKGSKKVKIKQKYYQIIFDFGDFRTPSSSHSQYALVKYVYGTADVTNYNYGFRYNKYNATVIKCFPDNNINLNSSEYTKRYLSFINQKGFLKAEYSFPVNSDSDTIINSTGGYDEDIDLVESITDIIDELPSGTNYMFDVVGTLLSGVFIYSAWATYEKQEIDENTTAPSALDKDWTLEEATEKADEMQRWSNTYLLPPIFGLTNCAYFPSNLGNTKSKFGSSESNPIIFQYPQSFTLKTDDYYGIKGKENETYELNVLFPTITESNRFEIIQDTYEYESNDETDTQPDYGLKSKTTFYKFKVNDVVNLRFIEQQDDENQNLIGSQKYNDFKFSGIIIKIVEPKEDHPETKGKITVKLNQDYNLTEDQYFTAKICLTIIQSNNFVQNETYSIKRYYKKDLGIGPRLGGSLMLARSNKTEGDFENNGIYLYTSVLKDEEKLNKPYLDVSYSGYYFYFSPPGSRSFYTIDHDFDKSDLPGQFEYILSKDEIINEPEDKQYHQFYSMYLIKNLDEHTYEYYQNLKKASGIYGLHTFRQANDNSNLTFE